MDRVHYKVTRLVNEQMKTDVKNALDKLDGVQMVNVDVGRGSIEVGYSKNELSESQIKQFIEKVGCKME